MADPYATLGVSRGASEKDIKSAYRKLAKELHPDRNKDNPNAAERFSQVTQAYDLLSDADKRARFDRGEIDADGNPANPFAGMGGGGFRSNQGGFRAEDFQGFGGGDGPDLGDIFEGLFGGGGRRGRAGQSNPRAPRGTRSRKYFADSRSPTRPHSPYAITNYAAKPQATVRLSVPKLRYCT